MARKTSTYGRREASDSEEDEDHGRAEALALERALSRRYTVNVSKGRRVTKRVRYEVEEDQVIEKTQDAINVNGKEIPIDLLASAVDSFMDAPNDNSPDHDNAPKSSGEDNDTSEGLIDEDLDDLLLSFGPQLRLEEKDDEDDDVDPSNVVEFCVDDVDNEKVSVGVLNWTDDWPDIS